MRQVSCEKKELKNVHVPLFELSSTWTLSSQPHVKSTRTKKTVEEEEALEDRNRKIGELFEWVGMACLGSQRFGFFFFFGILSMIYLLDSMLTIGWIRMFASMNHQRLLVYRTLLTSGGEVFCVLISYKRY
jgi:hypothetical protein